MHFVFTFPVKVFTATAQHVNRARRTFEYAGHSWLVFEGARIHFDTQAGKIRSTDAGESGHYWLISGDYAHAAGTHFTDESFKEAIDRLGPEHIAAWRAKQDSIVADIPAYETELRAIKAKADQERAERDKEQAERQARYKANADKEARERLETAKLQFMADIAIGWDSFEALCREAGIVMNIRTIGSARRSVSTIKEGGITVRKGAKPNMVFTYARQLKAALISNTGVA